MERSNAAPRRWSPLFVIAGRTSWARGLIRDAGSRSPTRAWRSWTHLRPGASRWSRRDGRFIVAFNGEVYNFQGLRGELEGRGHTFIGHSDTEVLLACFAEWGLASTLPRLDGMFALALWDRSRRVLHLARDRFGEKPMYYGWCGRVFLFGSELKAIRAHPAFDTGARSRRASLVPALRVRARTVVHLRSRPQTSACDFGLAFREHPGAMPEPSTYWNADERAQDLAGTFDGSFDECVDAVDELLGRSVRNRMLSDVPLGAFLSGGIDSSAVVSKMQEAATAPVQDVHHRFRRPSVRRIGRGGPGCRPPRHTSHATDRVCRRRHAVDP